jgi:hypothetical protein
MRENGDESSAKDKGVNQPHASRLFNELLKSYNNLDKLGFQEWIFHPAMLFGSNRKWWGDLGKRDRPHEGLDICRYWTEEKEIRYLGEKTKVPVIFEGRVVKVCNDFLGESLFISHGTFERNGSLLYTIYGHIKPSSRLVPGHRLIGGDIIGTIADARKSSRTIPPHLHVSVAWIPHTVSAQELHWRIIRDLAEVILVDPLCLIECPYSIAVSI